MDIEVENILVATTVFILFAHLQFGYVVNNAAFIVKDAVIVTAIILYYLNTSDIDGLEFLLRFTIAEQKLFSLSDAKY